MTNGTVHQTGMPEALEIWVSTCLIGTVRRINIGGSQILARVPLVVALFRDCTIKSGIICKIMRCTIQNNTSITTFTVLLFADGSLMLA